MSLVNKLAEVDRPIVIKDVVALIDSEVASKTGLMGMALKGGYKVVKKLKSGRMIAFAVDKLLDDFTASLADLYDEFLDSDASGFDTFLAQHQDVASDALLAITDDKAERADSKVIKKTYSKLRKSAKGHVVAALPGLGRVIEKHCPRDDD